MLDRALPPLPYDWNFPHANLAEAFAYTYWASYSDAAVDPRVLLAFQRAYTVTLVEMHAPVANGRPGYLIAVATINGQNKVIVAIEGTRTWSQVVNFWSAQNNAVTLPNSRGKVYSLFNTHANTIVTELMSNALFLQNLNAATTPITFTGYSLGAACAELCVEALKIANPTKALSVIKFGSPRIGNFGYMDRRSRTVIRRNVYCGRDPVDIFPYRRRQVWCSMGSFRSATWLPIVAMPTRSVGIRSTVRSALSTKVECSKSRRCLALWPRRSTPKIRGTITTWIRTA